MDKNSIIGIVLITGIIIVFSILNQPSKEEIARRKEIQDSLTIVRQEQAIQEMIKKQQAEEKTALPDTVSDSLSINALKENLGDFASASLGKEDFYTIENDLIKLTVSTKGGRPYSVELKNYKTFDSLPLILFSGDSAIFGFNFFDREKHLITTNNLFFHPLDSEKNVIVNDSGKLTMRLSAGDNKYIDYQYTLENGKYEVDFKVSINGLGENEISTRTPGVMDLTWEILSPQQERGKTNESNYTSLYYKPFKDEVEYFPLRSKKDLVEDDVSTKVEWVAFKDQFFSSVIISKEAFENAKMKMVNLPENSRYIKHFSAEIGVPISPNQSMSFKFYFGPNKYKILQQYKDLELTELVNLGKNIIRWINRYVILVIFDWLSKFIGNYGIIILLLTIIIKVVLLPLTYKSYLSMAKMRVLKPQIDELNKKYPKGKEMEKQQATMALYKKAGASPFGGCLPQLLQFPILFAMFRFFPTSIELRQESFLWAKDLSTYDSILNLPFNIPFGYGNHVSLFTLLMTVTTILSMRQSNQTTASSQQMPGMKVMMYFMPVMFMFLLNSWSSGLTYYYFLTNVISFGQNWLFKQFINEEELLKKMEARKAKPVKKSNFQKRLEEAAKKRGYQMPKK